MLFAAKNFEAERFQELDFLDALNKEILCQLNINQKMHLHKIKNFYRNI